MSPHPAHDPWASFLGDLGRSERVREILAQVLHEPGPDRPAKVEILTGSDPALREAITEMLRHIEAAESEGFLAVPADADDASGEPEAHHARTSRRLPEAIGPFEVIGLLGEGATGLVYRARTRGPLERDVAVKVNKMTASERAAARFAQEIELLGTLNHQNIAQIFEAGRLEDGSLWAACELVDGIRITQAAEKFALSWRDRVDLVRQAAVGLHHAHLHGVVHRDVKPSNLLVTVSDDAPPRLRIIDFGVARRFLNDATAEAVTEPGLLVGTLAYMAPEQLAGSTVDGSADVYALGLLLFETIEQRPARGDASGGLGELLRRSEQPVRERITDCDGHERDLEAIVAKATDPDPRRRYPSAHHMAEDLDRVLRGLPVLARRGTLLYVGTLFVKRRPLVSTLVMVTVVVIVAMLAAVFVSRHRLAVEVQDQRELLRTLIDDSLERLSVMSGTNDSRAAMVQSLHTRTDQLLQRAPNDPDLLRSKARLLREQGDLVASDSRFVEAEDCFAAAGTIYQSLYARNRNDLQSGRMWAEAAVRIGDIQRAQGDLNAAREHYLDAHASLLRMSDAHAEDISLRDDICWSLDRLASLDHATERHASMLEVLLERRRLSEALLADSPDRVLSRYNVAVGALRIAQYYIFLDDWEQAYDWATLAGPDISAVVAAEPERTHFVMWFVEWTTFIARALDRQGDWQGAAQHVRTSREVVSALWAKARGDWHALWLVLRVHYFAYSSFMGWDEQDEALSALRDGVRILESIPGERSIDAVRELERAILDAAQEHGLAAPVREAP